MSPATSRFCPECGAEHDADARFCEQCGHAFADAADVPTQAQPTAPLRPAAPAVNGAGVPVAAPQQSPTWPWIVGGIVAVLVLAGTAVALVLLLGGDDEKQAPPAASYAGQVATLIDPVGTANTTMSDRLGDLDPGDAIDDVASARRSAASRTSAAQAGLPGLTPGADDRTTAADAAQALRAERTLLAAMAAAIAKPSERTANALAAPSQAARDAWARLQQTIPDAGGTLDDVDRLAAWARAQGGGTGAAKTANPNGASCGGFEGVSGVFAKNVDCQTAVRVAVNAQSGGGTEGFACRVTGANDNAGTEQWSCSKGSATITFSATSGAAGDVPDNQGVPDNQTDVPEGTPNDVVPDDQTDVPEGTPDDVVPDDTGDQGVG